MAHATGQVTDLQIFTGFGKVYVQDETDGANEAFVLYSDGDGVVSDRVLQSMWVSMCRDAIVSGRRVSVSTVDANSALVGSIDLKAS